MTIQYVDVGIRRGLVECFFLSKFSTGKMVSIFGEVNVVYIWERHLPLEYEPIYNHAEVLKL